METPTNRLGGRILQQVSTNPFEILEKISDSDRQTYRYRREPRSPPPLASFFSTNLLVEFMGTPEFPDLGNHCSVEDCHLIDFLPFTCYRCQKVFCLEHRSYITHSCPKADAQNITVVICPLCAKGIRLFPTEDPNVSWESHANTECDPSNHEKVTKKKSAPCLDAERY